MKLTLAWIADAVGCQLVGVDAGVSGASIDSRSINAGELFVALPGSRVDGHDYVAAAASRGASGALVSRRVDVDLPQIICADVAQALTAAATRWRASLDVLVVGVTGSCGKTTVKDLIASVLSQVGGCHATHGNYNNELGVPLTLLGMTDSHSFAVIEMGASHAGDIAHLAAIAAPQVAVVTNAAAAHLAYFGDLQSVAATKGELFAALPADGIAIVNADDQYAGYWRSLLGPRGCLTFATDAEADISGHLTAGSLYLQTPAGSEECAFALVGRHNLSNALAAAAVAIALGIDTDIIARGLAAVVPSRGRMSRHCMRGGWTLIDDSYNANPSSLSAAIEVLVAEPGEPWLVLGDMAELGADAAGIHSSCGRQAHQQGVARLLTLGPLSAHAANAFGAHGLHFDSHDQVADCLRRSVGSEARVLVKGSRSAGMERVVDSLLRDPGALEAAA